MRTVQSLVATAVMALLSPMASAGDPRIAWYDPSCGFMLLELPEGFGLYQWKAGVDPSEGQVLSGDLAGGPKVEAELPDGTSMSLIHWADAGNREVLFKHTPRTCRNRPVAK